MTAATAFLGYMLLWTFRAGLGVLGTMGGLLLWALEAAALAMALSYGYEVIDVLARRRWPRRCTDGVDRPADDLPFVSLHVPAYNEPPEMVIATLESLLALDYPSYEIIMVDDNTKDPAVWGPVAAFCRQSGISFHHLEDWPGFKSGALNYALGVTDPRAEVVGVVDSDYLVDADWLRRTAPLFADPAVAFVQTPQHYRDWEHSSYLRRLFYSYEYFFSVTQASRNERDAPIFGGTMGLIRRSALEEVGGWDEWCITEDAELSLRLLRRGWSGLHVERPFGRGVMPLTFEALKRQRFRWCFGGVQILRKHWRSLMPWDRSPDNRLSLRQRYDYLAGGVQWFGDLLALAFAGLLVVGALNVATGSGLVFRRMSGALLAIPPLFLALAIARSLGALVRRAGCAWKDAVGALGVWMALSWTVALASAKGLVRADGVFLRTPKTRGGASWRDAVSANRAETLLAGALLASAVVTAAVAPTAGAVVLAGLVAWHGVGFALAPLTSLAAQRADLPDELRRRRRTEWLRERLPAPSRPLTVGAAGGSLAALGVALFLLLSPDVSVPVSVPDVVADARGAPVVDEAVAPASLGGPPVSGAPSTTPGAPEASGPATEPEERGGGPSEPSSVPLPATTTGTEVPQARPPVAPSEPPPTAPPGSPAGPPRRPRRPPWMRRAPLHGNRSPPTRPSRRVRPPGLPRHRRRRHRPSGSTRRRRGAHRHPRASPCLPRTARGARNDGTRAVPVWMTTCHPRANHSRSAPKRSSTSSRRSGAAPSCGSSATRHCASSRASRMVGRSRRRSVRRRSEAPDWASPKSVPWPRMRRSSSASAKPSWWRSIASRRASASGVAAWCRR